MECRAHTLNFLETSLSLLLHYIIRPSRKSATGSRPGRRRGPLYSLGLPTKIGSSITETPNNASGRNYRIEHYVLCLMEKCTPSCCYYIYPSAFQSFPSIQNLHVFGIQALLLFCASSRFSSLCFQARKVPEKSDINT